MCLDKYKTNIYHDTELFNSLAPKQSGTKPKMVAKILATNSGDLLCMGYQN